VLAYEYGALPAAVKTGRDRHVDQYRRRGPAEMPGRPRRTCADDGPADKVVIHLHLFIPAGAGATAENKGPFATIIRGDLGWGPVKPEIAAAVIQRGYILAEFDRTELAADKKPRGRAGFTTRGRTTTARRSAPGMGIPSRGGLTVDARRCGWQAPCDTGHSRAASASCSRARSMIGLRWLPPNDSGCRRVRVLPVSGPKSETIDMITKNFPYC